MISPGSSPSCCLGFTIGAAFVSGRAMVIVVEVLEAWLPWSVSCILRRQKKRCWGRGMAYGTSWSDSLLRSILILEIGVQIIETR